MSIAINDGNLPVVDQDLCASCGFGFELGTERTACPRCGSDVCSFIRAIEDKLPEPRDAVSFKQRRPGFPGILLHAIERYKTSDRGIPAHERLIIDRSQPDKTVKTHFVEEQRADGSWERVAGHDPQVEEWPAKTPRRGPPEVDS